MDDQNVTTEHKDMLNMAHRMANLERRCVLLGGLAGLAGVLGGMLGPTVFAPGRARAETAVQMSDAELLVALQNVFWTSAQDPHDKAFYVIAAPWCGVCKYFYGQLRDKTGFQARFVMTSPHSDEDRKLIAYAILASSAKGLDAIYASRRAPEGLGSEAARNFAVDVNTAAEIALREAFKARLVRGTYGYPLILFSAGGKLRGIAGAPAADALLSLVEARAGASREVTGLTPFLSNPPVITEASGVAGAHRAGVGVLAAPLAESPKLRVMNPGEGLPLAGRATVAGKTWLALRPFRNEKLFGYAPAEDFG